MTTTARDVLAFIEWGFHLLWREELRANPANWLPDPPRDARVQAPGEVEPSNEIDQYLPEYVGLLDVQLYWPGAVPA